LDFGSYDPITFVKKKLSPVEKIPFICKGPTKKHELPEKNFPQKHGNRFTEENYWRKISDDCVCRDWLSYAIASNRIFCLYCMFLVKNMYKMDRQKMVFKVGTDWVILVGMKKQSY